MGDQWIRTRMLLGDTAMERLRRAHVAVFGLGGVGSYTVEALARSGIGTLTLIDEDVVSESNLNRQIAALHSTVGLPKAEVLAARCRDIAPELTVHPICGRYQAMDRERFWSNYDCVVDAIDLVSCKIDLIENAFARNIPIISALGTGNKRDPSQLRIADLSETFGCPFARVLRRELRRRDITHLRVLFSPEPAAVQYDMGETPPPGRRSVPASLPWVTGCAGLMIAGAVVEILIGEG